MLWKSFKTILVCLLVGTFFLGISPKVLADAKLQNANTKPKKEQTVQLPKELLRAGYCESRLNQFNKDGTVLLGIINPADTGEFQINKTIWGTKAKSLGYDILTKIGNEKMAFWIYNHYGIHPWFWSYNPITEKCLNGIILPSYLLT